MLDPFFKRVRSVLPLQDSVPDTALIFIFFFFKDLYIVFSHYTGPENFFFIQMIYNISYISKASPLRLWIAFPCGSWKRFCGELWNPSTGHWKNPTTWDNCDKALCFMWFISCADSMMMMMSWQCLSVLISFVGLDVCFKCTLKECSQWKFRCEFLLK